MADATIHGIEFQIVGDTAEATKGINAFASTLNRLKSATSGGLGLRAVSKDFKLLGSVASGIRGIVSAPFKKSWESVTKYAKSIGGVVSGFKRILGYRLIRTVIKEIGQAFSDGLKNVYGWSKAFGGPVNRAGMTFAQTMDDIATSLAYFKNSVGAAVAPLFNLLAPAIRVVTDAAVQLLNVINQLFARLTGQSSWTRAIRRAEDYEAAVGGVGGAAKEALKYLAPFDELNVLPDNNKGGGGGSGGSDYSGIFEEVSEFESGIADFADRIRELIQNGEWAQLGQLIGDKINEIVNSIDWSGLGTKVGDKINALFTTEYWTLKTINFQNIGAKIAEFLTGENGIGGALRSIDFSTFGALLSEKLTIIPDLIIGAINKLDFKEVGKSLGDTFRGFFNNLSDWLIGIDFSELTENIINGIFDLIKGFDVKSAAESLLAFLAHAFKAVSDSLGTILGMIVNPIVDGITEMFTNDDGTKMTGEQIVNGILEGIKTGIANVGQWIKREIFDPVITGIKEAFGIHSPASTMIVPGEMIGQGILDGIKKPFVAIGDWIKTNILDPIRSMFDGETGFEFPFKIDVPDTVLATLKNIKKVWDSIKSRKPQLKPAFTGWSDAKQKALEKLKSAWVKINTKTSELTAKVTKDYKQTVMDSISSAWASISDKAAKFTASLSANSTVKTFIDAWNGLKDKALELKIGIQDKIKSAWNAAAKAWNSSSILSALGTLPYLANGGILNGNGQLFVARESGPEIVGRFGNQTGVMNNQQIVDSVSAGVARAIASVKYALDTSYGSTDEETMYRAMVRALTDTDFGDNETVVSLDGNVLYREMVRRNRNNTRMTGVNALA